MVNGRSFGQSTGLNILNCTITWVIEVHRSDPNDIAEALGSQFTIGWGNNVHRDLICP